MKILFINKFFFINGGSETVFFQERNYAKEKGIEIIDCSMTDSRNFPSDYAADFISNIDFTNQQKNTVQKIKTAFRFIHSNEAVNKIQALIDKYNPDIAHLHNIYHHFTPSIIPILKKNGVKVVLTLHDYKLVCPSYNALNKDKICTECAGKYFWKPITLNCQSSIGASFLLSAEAYWHKYLKSYNDIDLFIAPSSFMASIIKNRIHEEKIRIIHNGIEINKFKPNYTDQGYCLFLGRISKEKGIETLLEAHRSPNSLPLKIVGTGPILEKLKHKYTSANFLGYKSGKELQDLIADAAFLIVPSEWYENCSMVVLEAMALGKPVIGANIGGIPEQIANEKTGLLFEPGNAVELSEKMLLLSNNADLRKKLGFSARKKFEHEYSLEDHCYKLFKFYKELLCAN